MTPSPVPLKTKGDRPGAQRWLLCLILLLPWFWLFGRSLVTNHTLAFRDAAHFHYPTFHWNTEQWHHKQIPLWNPQENLGSPIMSDLSSSLFYPPKLVFHLPLPFPRLYNWYVAMHVLLAAYGTYRLSRYWQASCWGAAFAALSFSLGGSLLSQHANVIYLISAAWLPFALHSTDQMLVHRNWKSALVLAGLLALMTLGGDPQAAYHVGLLAGLYALILTIHPQDRLRKATAARLSWFQHRFILLLMAGSATFLLAAVQILPTFQWSQQSQRNSYSQPHSLYEIPATLKHRASSPTTGPSDLSAEQSVFKGLFTNPPVETHHRAIYHFSVGPWRFAELLWPNISGKMYPVHRRWINQLPAEGKVWSPTLYLGLLPLFLACAAWSLRSSDVTIRWLSSLVLLSMLASLGWFGLGWLLHEVQSFVSGNPQSNTKLGEPVGGIYWLLVQLLPGYVQFRYPAKWFVIASLALSLLAGKQFDLACRWPTSSRFRYLMLVTAILSGLGMISVLLLRTWLVQQLGKSPPHTYWGPLDSSLAIRDILQALGQTALISLCGWWLFRKPLSLQHRWMIPGVVCLTALEITFANSWLVISGADRNWQMPAETGTSAVSSRPLNRYPLRIYRPRSARLIPLQWSTTSSWRRHEQIVAWDRTTLMPRYHLLSSYGMVDSPGSIQSRDYRMLWEVAGSRGQTTLGDRSEPSILSLLGVDYQITSRRGPSLRESQSSGVRFQRLKETFPRVWISHEIVHFPTLRSHDPGRLRARTEAVFFSDGAIRNFQQTAVVESDQQPTVADIRGSHLAVKTEHCQIVDYQPQRVTIEAQLSEPGMVVLSDTYDTNWRATVSFREQDQYVHSEHCQVYRTNRLMRGIYLPAGDYRIVYRYDPSLFRVGSMISILAWLGLGSGALLLRKRRKGRLD